MPTRGRRSRACAGKPFPVYAIPLQAGISIGTLLISVELVIMLCILLFVPGEYAGPCFIGFAIGESLGAAALRIAGGIFTKIADIGADLMKIVFNIDEDDARNPGVIADCTGDNAGDSVGPTADGFETYGVTGVALCSSCSRSCASWLVAARSCSANPGAAAGLDLRDARADGHHQRRGLFHQRAIARGKVRTADEDGLREAADLAGLADLDHFDRDDVCGVVLLIPRPRQRHLWWKLSTIITCGTLAGAIIPELVKIFTSTNSSHVKEVVASSREGGASLNILSGFDGRQFQRVLDGAGHRGLMGIAIRVSGYGLAALMLAPAVFAFGLVAFGFLGMGPVTIAVDSYGPVADNAQSVFELSTIEHAGHQAGDQARFRLRPRFRKGQAPPRRERRRGQHVQGHGQAGADRHGGGRRDDADFLDHHGAHRRPHDQY